VGDEQFTIKARASAATQTSAFGIDGKKITKIVQGDKSESKSQGLERAQGSPAASVSFGSATAAIGEIRVGKIAAYVQTDLLANAVGGFYRSDLLTKNTPGNALAEAKPVFDIKFHPQARAVAYELNVAFEGQKQNSTIEFDVADSNGNVRSYKSDNEKILIQGDSNLQYTVSARLATGGGQEGPCCGWAGKLKGNFSVTLQRAGIIWARAQDRRLAPMLAPDRRVAGGRKVLPGEFPSVGALLYRGQPHCTGTLVGPTKVLTAAHCVYEYDLAQMTFGLGENAWNLPKPVKVVKAQYPNNELGFNYNDKGLIDDIAVVQIKEPLSVKVSELHAGAPKLDGLLKDRTPVSFVGYGYELVDGSPGGLGEKRMVSMPLSEVRPKTIHYGEPGQNTCSGDSGGPAMFIDSTNEKKWLLAGVTSAGDLGCTQYGINSRVDVYHGWIQKY